MKRITEMMAFKLGVEIKIIVEIIKVKKKSQICHKSSQIVCYEVDV